MKILFKNILPLGTDSPVVISRGSADPTLVPISDDQRSAMQHDNEPKNINHYYYKQISFIFFTYICLK